MAVQVYINVKKSVYSDSHARVLKRGESNILVWDNECAPWLRSGIAVIAAEEAEENESGKTQAQGDTPGKAGRGKFGKARDGNMDKPAGAVGGD